VLELACGTGLWTVELARHATGVTAVDASPEVMEINRARLREAGHETSVRYVRADLFDWRPDDLYDAVFFGFWLSHVPPERFEAFWKLVRSALRPGGRAFFVDSLRAETPDEKERRSRNPRDHPATRRRAGVPDRQDLLRLGCPRKAARRPGMAVLRSRSTSSTVSASPGLRRR
jgi:cyclopropane fatty-acyl-phospholipid synthase-like methyltransferase